ncbi:sensor histidine kinase [Streptomyces sp. NPDC020898]|uniref:sensor histidine kinase n=1 Tax=Streptomyces sp. NPDC020898 TaxID=3365101 RepID=UPI00378EC1F5
MTAPQGLQHRTQRLTGNRRAVLVEALAWCGGVAYVALLYVVTLISGRQMTGLRLAPAGLAVVLLLPLALRRPLPALGLLIGASFAATVTVDSAMSAGWVPWQSRQSQVWQVAALQAVLTDLLVGWIAATRGGRRAAAAALMALVGQIGAASYYRDGSDAFLAASVFLTLMAVTAWTVGHSLGERRRHAEVLRARTAAQAVVAERLRIARELHDMVAHSIGVIAIQAGVGRRVIDTQPAEARSALAAIEDTSRDTLAGLRRILGTLRRTDPADGVPLGPAPVLADLDRLAERTGDTGVRVDLERRGQRRELPTEIELSAYRIIQEAITNVVRHSGAGACRVTLDYQEDDLSIEIVDEGRGPTGLPRPSGLPDAAGYGLTGMRERAALLHGEFTAGPLPQGGFRVAARLPLPAAVG